MGHGSMLLEHSYCMCWGALYLQIRVRLGFLSATFHYLETLTCVDNGLGEQLL